MKIERLFAVGCALFGLITMLFPRFMMPLLYAWANLGRTLFSMGHTRGYERSADEEARQVLPLRVVGGVLFLACAFAAARSG